MARLQFVSNEVTWRKQCAPLLALGLAVLATACSQYKSARAPASEAVQAPAPARAAGGGGGGAVPGSAVDTQAAAAPAGLESMAAARKLIRSGRLSLEVESYAKAAEQAVRLAERARGYLADSQSTRSEHGRLRGSLTLRVPAEQFTTLLESLKGLGTVQSENTGTQDVTRAYTDLETRLRVKRDTAERLREILKTRTAKLSDVLEAERELARVTEEIETLEGERRFYDQQIALSTITAELAEPEPVVRSGFLDPIREALAGSLQLLGGSIAALVALTVILLPWIAALWLLWWLVRRLRGKSRPPAQKAA